MQNLKIITKKAKEDAWKFVGAFIAGAGQVTGSHEANDVFECCKIFEQVNL